MELWKLKIVQFFSQTRNKGFFGPMDEDTNCEGWVVGLARPPARGLLVALAFIQDLLVEHGWEVAAWSMDRPGRREDELLVHLSRYRHRSAEREHVQACSNSDPDWCALRPGINERRHSDSWWTDE